MSDNVQFIVDEHVAPDEAPAIATAVRERLLRDGWIALPADEECVLEGRGYRPGPQVSSWYARKKRELDFTTLVTNGVTFGAERFTNLTLPFDTDSLVCPRCKAAVDQDLLMEAVGEWTSGEGDAMVACESCDEHSHLRSWRSTDARESPVVCGHLTIALYNWPPLEKSGWKTSVVDAVADVIGRRPSIAWAAL